MLQTGCRLSLLNHLGFHPRASGGVCLSGQGAPASDCHASGWLARFAFKA